MRNFIEKIFKILTFEEALSFSLTIFIKSLALGISLYTSRWLVVNLNSKEFATYNVSLAYIATLLPFLIFGIPHVVHKFYTNKYSVDEKNSFWTTISLLRLGTFFIGLLLIFLTYKITRIENLNTILLIYISNFILITDLNYKSITDSVGKSWQFMSTDLLSKISLFIFIFVYSSLQLRYSQIDYFLYASIISYGLSLFADSFIQNKYIGFGKPRFKIFRENFKTIFFISAALIFSSLYTATDKLIMSWFELGDSAINSYSNAYRVYDTILFIPGVLIPMIASIAKKQMDNHKGADVKFRQRIFLKYLFLSFLVGLATTFVTLILGSPIIKVIDPLSQYSSTLQILPILVLAIPFLSSAVYISYLMVFIEVEKYDVIVAFLAGIFGFVAYYFAIQKFSFYGAAIVTILIYIVDLFIKFVLLRNSIKFKKYLGIIP